MQKAMGSSKKVGKRRVQKGGSVIGVYNDLDEHADFNGLRDWLNLCLKKRISADALAQFGKKVYEESAGNVKVRTNWEKVGIDVLGDDYISASDLKYRIADFYKEAIDAGVTKFICFDHRTGYGDIVAIRGMPNVRKVAVAVYGSFYKREVDQMEKSDYEDAFGVDLDFLDQ